MVMVETKKLKQVRSEIPLLSTSMLAERRVSTTHLRQHLVAIESNLCVLHCLSLTIVDTAFREPQKK